MTIINLAVEIVGRKHLLLISVRISRTLSETYAHNLSGSLYVFRIQQEFDILATNVREELVVWGVCGTTKRH